MSLVVHGFPPLPPLPSASPFCVKLETWLRMASIPYEARPDFNPMRAPKGKAPYVTLEDGSTLSDTAHILEKLSQRPEVTLDAGLTPEQRALSVLVQRTLENHLYFALLWARWIDPAGWAILQRTYFQGMPMPWLIARIARRKVSATLYYEGTGRHDPAEILASAVQDLDALQGILGDRPYFCGDRPTSVDATAYGMLASALLAPFPGPLQDAVAQRASLAGYVERMRARYWP
jgi:glutathione S-transferase